MKNKIAKKAREKVKVFKKKIIMKKMKIMKEIFIKKNKEVEA